MKHFSKTGLLKVFHERVAWKTSAGIDGLNAARFRPNAEAELGIAASKVAGGKYRFAPFAEVQMSKGRGRPPRIVAIPTVRDQVILCALKDYLHDEFEDAVPGKLPNAFIFDLKNAIGTILDDGEHYGFVHTDIASYYDSIDRETLMNFLRRRVKRKQARKLIYRAISNPVVPRASVKKERYSFYAPRGIPQGLAISNILASIYLQDFDRCFSAVDGRTYMRYVDDILILCPMHELGDTLTRVRFELAKLGLELNDAKTKTGQVGHEAFGFLGYTLKANGTASVRASSVASLVSTLAAKLTHADRRMAAATGSGTPTAAPGLSEADMLVEDLNERITGAISDRKRYGWLFYFSQIDDVPLLHQLDRIVTKLCGRCCVLGKTKPTSVKSFVKAFREMHRIRLGAESTYIPHYDGWDLRRKRKYLHDHHHLEEGRTYSRKESEGLFAEVIHRRMRTLEMDVKRIS